MPENELLMTEVANLLTALTGGSLSVQSYIFRPAPDPSAGSELIPFASTKIQLDGDTQVVVPVRRQAENEQYGVDTEQYDRHQRNVLAAMEHHTQAVECLIKIMKSQV